jgi:putative MATE family efflux protein
MGAYLVSEIRTDRLGTERISKLLRELSVPAILGMIINATYNVVDGIFIGRGVGKEALAGITVAFPVNMVSFAVIVMLATGGSALFSIYLGQRDYEKASYCVGNSYTLAGLMLGSLILLVLLFMNSILQAFGGSGEVLNYAGQYLGFVLPFHLVLGYQVLWENFTRAEGNARVAMRSMMLTSILNIALDYLFIMRFGWGVRGAAIATGIAQVVGTIYLARYVFLNSRRLVVARKYLILQKDVVRSILGIGVSAFARQTTFSLQALILNNMVVAYGGDLGLAILGVLARIFTFMVLPIFGVVQGMRPILSYNYGAKKMKRARETVKLSILWATGVLVIGFLGTQLLATQILSIFTEDAEMIREGARVLRICTLVFPIISVQMVGSASFQSLGRPVLALVFSVIRQILLFIPLVLVLPHFMGFDGIWWTYPISDVLAMLATGVVLVREMRKMRDDEGRIALKQ